MNYQLQIVELIKAVALLCQTELGSESPGRVLEDRRLSCMSYYITCSCSLPSGNLMCNPNMFERLTGCVLERASVKGR
jgi:hypothetical protein